MPLNELLDAYYESHRPFSAPMLARFMDLERYAVHGDRYKAQDQQSSKNRALS